MDPEQQAMLQALRGQYGQGGGFKPTQGMQFQGFQVPQHAPLAGPSLGGGGQGGGGGGGGGAGGMMEGAQKLIGQLAQNRGTRAGQPGGAALGGVPGGGPAGPPIVATQAEMGPFASQQAPPPGTNTVTASPPLAATSTGSQRPAPAAYTPPPLTGPQSDRALPQMQGPPMPQPGGEHTYAMPGPMGPGGAAMGMPANGLMRAGGELPDWLWRMPRMTGAMGL